MPPSTLKLYIDIAKTLMKHGPLNTQDLSSSLKVNSSSLKERINFLINEKLIREKDRDSSVTYIITKRGTDILKFFNVQPSIKIINDKK
jgi:predicted transcriptional regulator